MVSENVRLITSLFIIANARQATACGIRLSSKYSLRNGAQRRRETILESRFRTLPGDEAKSCPQTTKRGLRAQPISDQETGVSARGEESVSSSGTKKKKHKIELLRMVEAEREEKRSRSISIDPAAKFADIKPQQRMSGDDCGNDSCCMQGQRVLVGESRLARRKLSEATRNFRLKVTSHKRVLRFGTYDSAWDGESRLALPDDSNYKSIVNFMQGLKDTISLPETCDCRKPPEQKKVNVVGTESHHRHAPTTADLIEELNSLASEPRIPQIKPKFNLGALKPHQLGKKLSGVRRTIAAEQVGSDYSSVGAVFRKTGPGIAFDEYGTLESARVHPGRLLHPAKNEAVKSVKSLRSVTSQGEGCRRCSTQRPGEGRMTLVSKDKTVLRLSEGAKRPETVSNNTECALEPTLAGTLWRERTAFAVDDAKFSTDRIIPDDVRQYDM